MGSSRKHREKDKERDTKEKHRSRSRSKSKERSDKYDKTSHRSSHRHRDKEPTTGSRKRQKTESSDEERVERRADKKLKVKEVKDVSKTSNSSVNKTVKLDQKSSEESDRTDRRDGQQNKEDNVRTEGSNTESLSVEETNKLRLKLGLKPLETNDSENKPKEGTDTNPVFFKTENLSVKLEAEKLKERIEIQRNKRKGLEKLKKIKGLAESDSEEEEASASAWVIKNRQFEEEKARANKTAQLLEEMDEEFGVSSIIDDEIKKKRAKAYSTKDLKGLTVGHKTGEFKEGHLMILTLKDKEVLNEGEDVLVNVDLVDKERTDKNIENKSKRPEYKPYDEPEFDEFGILQKKSLLSKYDEEIEGPKKDSFKLGFTAADKQKQTEMIRMKLKQEEGRISLIAPKPQIVNEYYTEEEMTKFKKPKKIRNKGLRKKEPILETNDMEVFSNMTSSSDHGSRKGRNKDKNTEESIVKLEPIEDMETNLKPEVRPKRAPNILDIISSDDPFNQMNDDLNDVVLEEDEADKELQMALHKARKLKHRDNLDATTGAASIAKVAQTIKSFNNENEDSNDSESFVSNNIILNSTAEFCRNLGDIPTYGLAGNRDDEQQLIDLDEDMTEELIDSEPNKGQWNEVDVKEDEVANDFEDNEGQPILEEEPDVTKGLAGALQLAMKKGYLDKEVKKQVSATRQSALEAQSYTIEEKFYEDDKIGRRERYNGPVSEFREKHEYKPDIKLDYVDEKGRVLDQKEAFRYLSHKFHGKGPSKNKIDKRMKKKDQEGKLRQMSSTDTPLNTLKMLTDKQKEMQTPYIILTGAQKTGLQNTISKTK